MANPRGVRLRLSAVVLAVVGICAAATAFGLPGAGDWAENRMVVGAAIFALAVIWRPA